MRKTQNTITVRKTWRGKWQWSVFVEVTYPSISILIPDTVHSRTSGWNGKCNSEEEAYQEAQTYIDMWVKSLEERVDQ